MKKIVIASFAALGLAGTASAADLAVKAPVVYAPAFNWTGCYLGINGGWIGSDEDYRTEPWGRWRRIRPDFHLAAATREFSSDESGGTAGGQFGCQLQWGSWVLGGEWDWNWSGLEEDNNITYGRVRTGFPLPWPPREERVQKQLDWFMTMRARLGWAAWDRFMIYATGGVAMGAYDAFTHVNFIPGTQPDYFGSYREKRIGYTVGGGFEWAFANNWSARAEFLYLDFDSFDYVSPHRDFEDNQFAWKTTVDAQEYVVRVGLNYLFHVGDPPVVARN